MTRVRLHGLWLVIAGDSLASCATHSSVSQNIRQCRAASGT